MSIQAPISVGELFDKITILEIKEIYARGDEQKLANVRKELELLRQLVPMEPRLPQGLIDDLRRVNHNIWVVEEALRQFEAFGNFTQTFIMNARQVYSNNDKRAAIKKQINNMFNSEITEEKVYTVKY
jgi:hypothetical protein